MTKKMIRNRTEAKKLMWDYYRENKGLLPCWIKDFREEIIEELKLGMSPEDAFNLALHLDA